MGKAERVALIEQIEGERETHLISYITSTRQNLEVNMAMDSIRKIYDHLLLINTPKEETKIDLFIHSNGGDGTVPWKLVTLIREFAEKFSVLVPHKAFSAATLTALGADSIVMHPMGMLGPTDPTVVNLFNPINPSNPSERIGISVEDVTAYIALIKEDVGIHHEDELVQAFNKLAENVHPLALGNVKRSLSQSRMMAKKLLALHMNESNEVHRINDIVDNLTSKLYYHGHPINRQEAKEQVDLQTIENPTGAVEELMWQLYLDYEQEIKMEEPFNQAQEFVAQHPGIIMSATPPAGTPAPVFVTTPVEAKLAFVESRQRTDAVTFNYQIVGQKQQDGSIEVKIINQAMGWKVI